MQSKRFKVGDRVLYKPWDGPDQQTTIIDIGDKDGRLVYDLDNGHWAYPDQLVRLETPRVAAKHVRFNTSEYVFSHGHEPRGRGSWAFEFEPGKPEWARIERDGVVFSSLTYGEAKRWALRQAVSRGIDYVLVCS